MVPGAMPRLDAEASTPLTEATAGSDEFHVKGRGGPRTVFDLRPVTISGPRGEVCGLADVHRSGRRRDLHGSHGVEGGRHGHGARAGGAFAECGGTAAPAREQAPGAGGCVQRHRLLSRGRALPLCCAAANGAVGSASGDSADPRPASQDRYGGAGGLDSQVQQRRLFAGFLARHHGGEAECDEEATRDAPRAGATLGGGSGRTWHLLGPHNDRSGPGYGRVRGVVVV